MGQLIIKSSQQSGKKPVLCMLGLSSPIIGESEQSDQESATYKNIALAI